MTAHQEEGLYFENRFLWREWLIANHNNSEGIWMVYYKKQSKKKSISYGEAVEEALCFGWIDSRIKSIDNERYMQKYTPRRKNSLWSKVNRERVEKMIQEGKMTAFGMAKVEEAKKNGQWEKAYGARLKPEMPEDLRKALQKNEKAFYNFQNFPASSQTTYIYWLNSAKRPETREKRINNIVQFAFENRKPGII